MKQTVWAVRARESGHPELYVNEAEAMAYYNERCEAERNASPFRTHRGPLYLIPEPTYLDVVFVVLEADCEDVMVMAVCEEPDAALRVRDENKHNRWIDVVEITR